MHNFTPSEGFLYFLQKFGIPFASQPADKATLQKYQGVLPSILLDYWQAYGFCGFYNGLLWLTNPDDYEGILQDWLPPEILQEQQLFVFARTAFGKLFVWEPRYGQQYSINPILGNVIQADNDSEEPLTEPQENRRMERFFTLKSPSNFDTIDNNSKYIFDRCVKKHGALADNEMFAFVPPVFISNDMSIKNIQKVDLHVHFDIIRQLTDPEILTMDDLLRIGWGR